MSQVFADPVCNMAWRIRPARWSARSGDADAPCADHRHLLPLTIAMPPWVPAVSATCVPTTVNRPGPKASAIHHCRGLNMCA